MISAIKHTAFMALMTTALGMVSAALAQPSGLQSGALKLRSGSSIVYGRTCDRAALRDCQADAKLRMMAVCEPFPGRLGCASEVLADQSQCMAATGCD